VASRASVIIVNYNGRHYLENCLSSLLQDGRDHEIILVDNASTDGSAGYVEQVFPMIKVLRNEINQGFGGGNNVGARSARGEVLAFLNPDVVVEPGWLEALVKVLDVNPSAGLVTSRIMLLCDRGRVNTCGNDIHLSGLTLCRGMRMDPETFNELAEVGAVSGAAFAIRRDLFKELGGFDEAFFLYMEDTDLSWRARLAGYQCLYVPSSVVYHDYTLRFGPRKTFYQERNRYLMLLKSLQWRTLLVLAPALLLAEVVTWGFALLRDRQRLSNKLRAYGWLVKHWGQVMAKRRETQALRRARDRDLLQTSAYRLGYEQTGEGLVVQLAHAVFDPLFFIFQRLALAVIRW